MGASCVMRVYACSVYPESITRAMATRSGDQPGNSFVQPGLRLGERRSPAVKPGSVLAPVEMFALQLLPDG